MAGHKFRVAESCTALGFMKWLLVFALAYTYLFPVSRLHAVLLILSAPVIAYMVNLLRAFSLVLNPSLEVLELHIVQGIVFFLIGFSLLYAIDATLLRLLGNSKEIVSLRNANNPCEMNPERKHWLLLILLALYSVLFAVSLAIPRWSYPSQDPDVKIVLDEELAKWKQVHTPPLNRLFLGSVRYSSFLHRTYSRKKERITIFIGYDDRQQRNRSILSDKNAYPVEIGLVEERSLVELDAHRQPAISILTDTMRGRFLAYHWYEGINSVSEEILRALLALDQSPLRRPGGALVVRVATYVPPTPQGKELADKRLREFLHDMKKQRRIKREPD